MSDPRNVAHAKKVSQEKKHHGTNPSGEEGAAVQPGKKAAGRTKKRDPAGLAATAPAVQSEEVVTPSAAPAADPPIALEGLLAMLAKLKEMEVHSRANLERLAAMVLTIEEELKQPELAAPLGSVYPAQNDFETKLATLIAACQTACDRLRGDAG